MKTVCAEKSIREKKPKNKVVCINFENSFLSIYKDILTPLNFIDEEKLIFKIKDRYFNLSSISIYTAKP